MRSADVALLARDPGLPGLALLLDDDALAARLGAPVRRRYLRYKPGTSCVLGLDVDGRRCFAVAYAEQAAAKLAKSAASAPRSSVLVVDEGLRVLVARPSADRDLPALARLARDPRRALERALRGHDLTGAQVRVLSHKPQRRWVGRLELPTGAPVVLRAHRPEDAQATLGALRVLDGARARTPRLLGSDPRLGLVAVSWLPGTGLHELLAAGAATSTQLRATGAALAELHAGALDGLALRTPASDAEAVRRAAGAVADLLPALADQAAALAARIERLLPAVTLRPVAAHGDLSADQVVVGPDGCTGLIDLDAACAAEAELDLGSAAASLRVSAVGGAPIRPAAALDEVVDGYGGPVDDHRLQVHTAAALLRRVVEPFRTCRADWDDAAAQLLALADAACPRPVRA